MMPKEVEGHSFRLALSTLILAHAIHPSHPTRYTTHNAQRAHGRVRPSPVNRTTQATGLTKAAPCPTPFPTQTAGAVLPIVVVSKEHE
jgi:hypothetical protein